MIAFEILVNGHHIQTVAAGELGMVTANLMAHRIGRGDSAVAEEIWLHPSGVEDGSGDHVEWATSYLKVGDAVTIRIVERGTPGDSPYERRTSEEVEQIRGERRDRLS